MEINENSIEKSLCNDAAKIVIDEDFKLDLKNKIMFAGKYNNITEQPKHKNNFMKNRYFKIASGFVICVFVSGTIFKAIDIQSKNIFTKSKEMTNSTIPSISTKGSIKDSSKQASALKVLDDLIKNNYINKQFMAVNANENSVSDILSGNSVKNATGNLLAQNGTFNNGIIGVANPNDSNTEINQGQGTVGKPVTPAIVIKTPTDVPSVPTVPSVPAVKLIAYDSRYSTDATKLASVKDDGIYIEDLKSSKETKLIAYNDKTQVVNKPNFTPSGGIIYYKADLENGGSSEKNGAIYLSSENGKVSTKIADGKNPMISKDGENLVYENEGKIYKQTLKNNNSWYIATGKYPAFSNDGNLISYVKEGIEVQNSVMSTARTVSFARVASTEKTISTLCVYNFAEEQNASITDKGSNADSSIESWSGAIRNDEVTSESDVTSQYSYYESIWSLDNKEVHVIKVNNETGKSEVNDFKLDN